MSARLCSTDIPLISASMKYPRYLICTPYNGMLVSQTRHD
ncbi:hypothetical protein AC84_5491 [Escherichia coli 1-392-07_S4_C1]|nr:hypothetical protein AB70_2249 [Escherichia coli 1-176-05_S1_C3]EZK19844.1 hypothetical protein AB39_2241 [Escherichia coli 1-176-05_S1_C2]KEN78497.1 hypothetical protein AD40_6162 [Escherichia coli 1-392-07_S4_C3]KEN92138.1 hypothetical protein AC84_5491 [Escherichia coli 1-392-07_S4_C1]